MVEVDISSPDVSDPLAAAWMAKRFGMRFQMLEVGDGGIGLADVEDKVMKYLITEESALIYLHPDSLHLLDPQKDDEGTDCDDRQCVFDGDRGWLTPDYEYQSEAPVETDTRNGVHFMWPESEEV